MLTYKSLYSLVDDQINQKIRFKSPETYYEQAGRSITEPFMMSGSGRRDISVHELIEAMQTMLDQALPDHIIEGLEVTATDPISNAVIITAGKGSAGGIVYELDENVTIAVPFDSDTRIFYVNLYQNSISFDKNEELSKRLTVAKIVIPKPGTTNKIKDRREDNYPWDAYIVNLRKYYLYGINNKLEEDTIDLLRDSIGDVLADNLIGNIRLSENLKVINTAGTVEMDSKSIKIYDESENKMAEFNKDGTFFYDVNGIEIAKFAADEARVGNILITKNSIQSANFVSNTSGFKISDSGFAEFEDVIVRGVIRTTVFEYNTISAVGGAIIIANSSQLTETMTTSDSSTLTVEEPLFSVNEVLIVKEGDDEEYMLVTNIGSAPTYTVTRDLKGTYAANNNPAWQKGTAIVSQGVANQGYIKLDATSEYSPYMDIVLRNSTTWNDIETKVRLGRLDGITDTDLGVLSGYGLYSDNAYLKGELFAEVVKTANSGSRIYMNTDKFIAYDDDENKIFQIYMDDVSGEGDVGDIYMGDYAGGEGIFWDASAGTMYLRGVLDADDITVGHLSVSYLESGTMAGAAILLDSASYIQSTNYVAGTTGWKLAGNGTLDIRFTQLYDVNLNAVADDEILRYDNATGKWRNEVLTDYLPLAGGIMVGDIDMSQNEIKQLVIENRTGDPGSPVTGQIWFRTDT